MYSRLSRLCICAIALVAVLACKQADDEPDVVNADDRFESIFDSVDPAITWNLANPVLVEVMLPNDRTDVDVYGTYFGQRYWLANAKQCSQSASIWVSAPLDMTEFEVVVNSRVYHTRIGEHVDARYDNGAPIVASDYDSAEPFAWVMAADVTTSCDFDFNDVVARFQPMPDGSLNITALAAGEGKAMWLHFFDGVTDYIITPQVYEGYVYTDEIPFSSAAQLQWHKWFADLDDWYYTGLTLNTLGVGGVKGLEGATVNIPAEILGDLNIACISMSSVVYPKDQHYFARPEFGFYISVDAYDINNISYVDNDVDVPRYYDAILTMWPAGYAPQVIVVPDICQRDNDVLSAWCWPSELSPIYMVYPSFVEYMNDPDLVWSTSIPCGWDDRPANKDINGKINYFGFYPR